MLSQGVAVGTSHTPGVPRSFSFSHILLVWTSNTIIDPLHRCEVGLSKVAELLSGCGF